jgi:hypothetical protein
MTSHAHVHDDHDHDTNAAVPVGWVGLLIPFVLIFAAVLAFGARSPGQIAGASVLLLVPLAVLGLRRAQRRSMSRP